MFSKKDKPNWKDKRKALVEHLKKAGYLNKPEVIEAVLKVPRHKFVPLAQRPFSYADQPLAIGYNQTISAPHMVSLMAEKLDLVEGLKVLEVGGGSGYHAAVIGEIVGPSGHVYSVEIIPQLSKNAKDAIEDSGLSEVVSCILGDGSVGYPEEAPYDRIFVACAAPDLPPPLAVQLKEGGKMLIPVDTGMGYQDLVMYEKQKGKLKVKNEGGCVFVPLVGKWGF
jgi:protein-L-isoaspartate(D-aspartate) O-methyltransferase